MFIAGIVTQCAVVRAVIQKKFCCEHVLFPRVCQDDKAPFADHLAKTVDGGCGGGQGCRPGRAQKASGSVEDAAVTGQLP